MNSKTDKLYRQPQNSVAVFEFDDQVAGVFSDMISRSVPGYTQIIDLLPTLVRRFRTPEMHYYDLGCSLGAGMLAMADALQDLNCSVVGVDNSAAMLAEAEVNLDKYRHQHLADNSRLALQLECADLAGFALQSAAMVLMNFTLQFVPLENRDELIRNIYSALIPGGALVLSEKIKFSDAGTDKMLVEIHHQYKSDQGYSQMEISQKRDAIENVLIPETLDSQLCRLKNAGFSIVTPWLQNLQFVSILAVK